MMLTTLNKTINWLIFTIRIIVIKAINNYTGTILPERRALVVFIFSFSVCIDPFHL